MSLINKNFRVEYIDNVLPTPNVTDITDFIVSLDDFVLQSTGILATAAITLNAEFGSFMTDDGGGTTPIISQFDRIRVTVIGDDGITEQSRIFEVKTDLAQLATSSSHFLPLELEGRERNISGIPFGGFFRSATHFDIVEQSIFAYNAQKGTSQPQLVLDTLNIPNFNPNIWDFTQVDNCYDALLTVLDSLDLPVSAGGGGNRFAFIFEDIDLVPNFLSFRVIIQGTNNIGSIPTLEQNDTHPITKIDKIKQASTGTLVVARGRAKTATQPNNYAKFISLLEFYKAIKQYDTTIVYPEDSFVTFDGVSYQANQEVPINTPPPDVEWTAINVGDFIGILQYSPFTNDKLTPIKNGFANPTGGLATDASPDFDNVIAIPDHNLFINDRSLSDANIGTYRNWVMFRTNTVNQLNLTADQRDYLFDIDGAGSQGFGFYEGFRVLVDPNVGALEAPFDGNDSNGFVFAGSVAVFKARPNRSLFNAIPANFDAAGEWFVVRPVETFDQTAVYDEAKVYEFNVDFVPASRIYPGNDRRRGTAPGTLEWRNISGLFMGNDCFHTPSNIEQVDGLFGDSIENSEPLNDPNGDPYIENSAIKITYGYDQSVHTPEQRDVWFKTNKTVLVGDPLGRFLSGLVSNIYNTFTTPNYTNMGWWYAWPTPYPFNRQGGIIENIGELYGGNLNTLNRHRYFDLFNIQYTTTGQIGWTHSDSADLSEITGVQFLFNFDIITSTGRIPFTGDIPFTYWCIDDQGTRWKSKKISYRHLGETQLIQIEFGDLSPVFSTRTPLGIQNSLENIIVPEIEVNEIFFKDKVMIQGFQCEVPYDEYGRYAPNLIEQIINLGFFDAFTGGSGGPVSFIGIIDAYSFIKTPVAISTSNTLSDQRTIIPQFKDYQNIVNVEQLQRFADSASQVEQFPYEQYTVQQGGINDLELEDSIFLHDEFMINEEDDPGNPNTRLVSIREIHYSVPFRGGLIRKLVLAKVIDV